LKYGPVIKFVSLEKNADGSIASVKAEILPDYQEKLKGHIHWVSKQNSITCTANLYAIHFLIEDIKKAGDKWLEYINPESLVVKKNAKIWNIHKGLAAESRF